MAQFKMSSIVTSGGILRATTENDGFEVDSGLDLVVTGVTEIVEEFAL